VKRCSQCGRTYAEESLAFCLDDGSLLSAPYDPNATLRMAPPTNPTATEVLPSGSVSRPVLSKPERPGKKPMALYLTIVLGALIVGGAVVGWVMSGRGESAQSIEPALRGESANANMARPAPTLAGIDISGDWLDQFGFVTHVSQKGDGFQFTSTGRACRGRFVTSGSGTIRGNTLEYDYTSNYSSGHCAATVTADGMHLTADCLDTACGRFLTSSRRQ
jgi:hypothetical protein